MARSKLAYCAAEIISCCILVLALMYIVLDLSLNKSPRYQEVLEKARTPRHLWEQWNRGSWVMRYWGLPKNPPDFKPVSGLGPLHYVYAALWQGDNVRITAIKTRANFTTIYCVLWFSSEQNSDFTTVKASVVDLQVYAAKNAFSYIKCALSGKMESRIPLFVGLLSENRLSAGPRIVLPVENRNMDRHRVYKYPIADLSKRKSEGIVGTGTPEKDRVVEFTVCVPAMFNYSNAAQLVEKLEMMRLMGAGRVVIYAHSMAQNVRSVLEFYIGEWTSGRDTLEVIVRSWKIPPVDVHYMGQLGAIDDCLYRYGWLSKYMIFDDLDEVILPFRHGNWSGFVAEKEKERPGTAAYMFLMSVMNKDHSTPAKGFEAAAIRYQSSVLGFTRRDDHIFTPVDKSKLIVNPRRVESMDIHQVFEGYGPTYILPPLEGIVYHYRWPNRPCKTEIIDTRLVNRFGKNLLARLKSVWSKLKGVPFGWQHPKVGEARVTCRDERCLDFNCNYTRGSEAVSGTTVKTSL